MAAIELRRQHDHATCVNCGSHWFKCCAVFNRNGRPVARTTEVECADCGTPASI